MDLKTKIILAELYSHYWPWNKNGEEVDCNIREKERKTRDAMRSKIQKKQKVTLKKLERSQRIRGKELERVVYDPESVKKFGGMVVEWIAIIIFFEIIDKNHVLELTLYHMYKIFPISMQKTVRPQIRPGKKNSPLISS